MNPMAKKPVVIGGGDGYGVNPYTSVTPQGAPLRGERPIEDAAREQFAFDVAQMAKKRGVKLDYDTLTRALSANGGSDPSMTVPEYSGHVVTNVGSGADSIEVRKDTPGYRRDSDERMSSGWYRY